MICLLVDDHPVYRKGLIAALGLAHPGLIILEAGDGEEALALFQKYPEIELCVVDINLPKLDGISLISKIHEERSTVPIIVNSGFDSIEQIGFAIDAGASGYISKSTDLDAFTSAVIEALKGNLVLSGDVAARLRKSRMQRKEVEAKLSPRQIEVLKLCGEGMSNKEIANRLLVSEATVKAHLGMLMRLLEKNDRTSCVVEAIRRGWINPTLRSA